MFKSTRWRSDKNKIKAVFKLQFHATQLAPNVGEALTIALIPGDVGKPTTRLEKTKVKNGSCYWEKPHYETLKFTQDQKTGKINEKLYRFVVATGSLIFGVVGEVSLDFSCYAEATKPSSVSLSLKNAKSTSLLHVSIQRVLDQREVDVSESVNEGNQILRKEFSNGEIEARIQSDPPKDHEVLSDKINRNHGASSGSDITLSGSDISSGLDNDTPRASESKNATLAHGTLKTTIYEEHQRSSSSQWDWLDGPVLDLSTDDSSMISPTVISEEGCPPDDVIKKLKGEFVTLARQAEVSEMELQTLRKQIAKESKKGQELCKEMAALKEERNELKEECEKIKAKVKVKVKVNCSLMTEGGDPWALVDELKQELSHEKDLNSNLRLQLQKTQESNAELILAVQDLEQMLESKSKSQEVNSKSHADSDKDQKALEEIVREHSGVKDAYLHEQKIIDLHNEIESCKREKDELEMQMEHIALDYEILKQENNDMCYKLEQSQLQEQLKMQYECSTSYATVNELESQIENLNNDLAFKSKELSESILEIKELETHIKNLEEDLDNQAHGFEADMEDLIRAKVEQEKRAIYAEESLRKVKLQNANTAGKLQEEFRKISTEMASAFQESEYTAMKAINEANQLRVEKRHLEETVKKVKEEVDFLGDQYEVKLVDLSNQITLKSKHLDEMEKLIENLSHELKHQKDSYKAKIENLENERNNLENEISLVKMELKNVTSNDVIKPEMTKNGDQEMFEASSNEVELLNKNKDMEIELKELQERYSEISLKFAEVEGERQQLVMRLRNLKNTKK